MAERGSNKERDDVTSQPRHDDSAPQSQELTEEAIRAELRQVCNSESFRKSERQKRFLTFVVEQTLGGKASEIKEPVLAMEVFDRPSDYDPKVDTIVRVEARRLRAKLAEYYASAGAADPLRIELPTGSYVPVFQAQVPPPTSTSEAPASGPGSSARFGWLGAIVPVILVLGAGAYWLNHRASANSNPRIAVLPFQNLNSQAVDELYADGVTEALITDLAKIKRLQVISRTSVMRFKKTRQSLREIASQLQADYIVEGSFQRNGDQCRITAQLIRTSDDVHIWAEPYDLPFTDILRVQRRVATEIVNRVNVALDSSDRQVLESQPTSNTEAYDDLLKARRNSYQYLALGKQDYYDEAERLLERALQLEPSYADAILERALLDGRRYQNTGDPQWRAKAADNFQTVLYREPCQPVANAVMASIRNEDGDADDAMKYGLHAVECNPNSAQAHNALGLVYISSGFYEAAADEFRASSRVDPVFVSAVLNLSQALTLLNQKRDALAVMKKATEIEPESPLTRGGLGLVSLENGNFAEAATAWDKATRFVEPEQAAGIRDIFQGLQEAASGRMDSARQLLRRHRGERFMQSVLWRVFYERLVVECEEPAEVVALLQQLPELRSYRYLVSEPALARLRRDPGFIRLLQERYKLWQEQLAKYGHTVSSPPPKLPPPESFSS